MNIRHHIVLVRQFELDGSFHCDVHGLLWDEEARDVLFRAGLDSSDVPAADRKAKRWPWRLITAVIESTRGLRRPECELLS